MTGYVRVDTSNNIADGNVISAADLDNEFDGVQAGFNASTGHTHGGAAGEGAPITKIGPTQDVTASASLLAPKTTNTVDVGSSLLKFKDLWLSGNASVAGTLGVTGVATLTAQPILSSLTASRAVFTDASKGLVSNAITGTGNVVMSASPTLTGTINAEALTLSGTVTATGGTANGVTYLNGSKVLTSGSALTFDGNNLSIGANGQVGSRLSVIANGAMATFNTGAAADGRIEYAYNGTNIFYTGVNSSSLMMLMARSGVELGFGANNTEQMRLTSTGLGIGTSSPSYKVEAIGSSPAFFGESSTNGTQVGYRATIPSNSANCFVGWVSDAVAGLNGDLALCPRTSAGGKILFFTGSTTPSERMRLDSSGNLGLGVTPSAWASAAKVFEVGSTGSFSNSGAGDTAISDNRYFNGSNNIYKTTNAATIYSLASGQHRWFTAPSGTAGAAITFTQAMTLDASGNLVVGDTSASYRLDVKGSTGNGIAYRDGTVTNYLGTTGSNLGYLGTLTNHPVAFLTNATERARIDSSGNLIQSAPTTAPTLATNGTMVFNLTSNTNLRVSVRGSDGVTRTANLTLA